MNQEIERYNRPRVGLRRLIQDVGYALYRRLRGMIAHVFTFTREDNGGGAGDMPADDDNRDKNWVSRAALSFCSAFRRERPESVCGEQLDLQSALQVEFCPSTVVTIGSTIPSGSELFDRESDIEFYYPNPSFIVEEPTSSESDVSLVHKSVSENML